MTHDYGPHPSVLARRMIVTAEAPRKIVDASFDAHVARLTASDRYRFFLERHDSAEKLWAALPRWKRMYLAMQGYTAMTWYGRV